MCWNGSKGKCVHIMYSDNISGNPMYDKIRESTKFIGYYIDSKSKKSKDSKDYKWEKI